MIKVFRYLSSKYFSSLRQISILFRNTHSTITQSLDYHFLLNFCFLRGLKFWNSLIKGNRINTQQWFTSDKLQYTHGTGFGISHPYPCHSELLDRAEVPTHDCLSTSLVPLEKIGIWTTKLGADCVNTIKSKSISRTQKHIHLYFLEHFIFTVCSLSFVRPACRPWRAQTAYLVLFSYCGSVWILSVQFGSTCRTNNWALFHAYQTVMWAYWYCTIMI